MMLMLTHEATEVVKGLTAAPGAEGLRISSASGSLNSHGPGLQVELVATPEPDDALVEAEGARIFLDQVAAGALDGKVLHAEVEDDQVRFAMVDQNELDGG
jgi:iron-sulfur cluster assembly protein